MHLGMRASFRCANVGLNVGWSLAGTRSTSGVLGVARCGTAAAGAKSSTGLGAAATTRATAHRTPDLAHPCPICLVNEDDHGRCGQCCECGRLYCGDCNVPTTMGRIAKCPICCEPFAATAEVIVERLRRLVTRSPGRHTLVAQNSLGAMYAVGTGVTQDHAEAVRWYRLAADQGHANGQYNLGVMYAHGTGVP